MLINAIRCAVCATEESNGGAGIPEIDAPSWESMRGVRITTEDAQLLKCSKGHEFMIHIQDGGYALLYERALQRTAYERTRDAILDAFAAFDMFLEWIVLGWSFELRYGTSTPLDQAPLEPVREDLKFVMKSSERTMGAALTLVSGATKKAPPTPHQQLNELRDKADPSLGEAMRACLHVEGLVCSLREGLPFAKLAEGRFRMALVLESQRRAIGERSVQTSSHSLMTVLAADAEPGSRKASDRLVEYRRGDRSVIIE